MEVIHAISANLAMPGSCPVLHAVQFDGVRRITAQLYAGTGVWAVPEGVTAGIGYTLPNRMSGYYEKLEDGTAACSIEGSTVTAVLSSDVTSVAGDVRLSIIFSKDGKELSTFPLKLRVTARPGDGEYGEPQKALTAVELLAQTEQLRDEAAATAQQAAADAAKGKADGMELDAETGELVLTAGEQEVARVALPQGGGGGVGFESWAYDQETMMLHLYDADGNDVIKPVYIPGGGDAGSRLTVAMETAAAVVAAESAEKVELAFTFTSVDSATGVATGDGTMQIAVGGVVKRTSSILQGRCALNIRPYLNAGSNAVTLTVTDAYGTSAVRQIAVTLETLSLEWSLEATAKTETTLSVSLTPYGNYTKTIHLAVDGEEIEVFEVSTSGRRTTKIIPQQTHGGHIITAWAEMEAAGTDMVSDTLTCACAWVVDRETPAIVCVPVASEADQFSTVRLVHRVIDYQNNPAQVEYLVNGVRFKLESVDQSEQVWSYRLTESGEVTLTIRCGEVRHDVVIQVAAISSAVQEVTDGLVLKADPALMANLEEWESDGYSFTLSEGFDLVNGGLVSDEDGRRCIRVTAGDRLTLNYPLFAQDSRSKGLGAKLIYAVRSPSAKHCTAISCQQGTVGLEIQPNNVYLRGNQTVCKLSVCEDELTELDITIQPDTNDGIMYLWERCSTFAYMKYAADESFTHTENKGIVFGCDEADVYLYLARFYDRDLTDAERLANHIFDGGDTAEILARQERNDIYDSTGAIDIEACAANNPDCHHIVISAERMTKGKKDEVKGSIRHIYKSGGPEHQFTTDVSMFVQGTSSVEHAETAGPNINFYFPGGITLENGTAVPEGYAMNGGASMPVLELCWKKNIASEDHIVNAATAEWYNRYQPSVRPEREADPRVRDCLDSCMCAVYFHNSGSSAVQVGPDLVPPGATIFFGLGNLCSNKDSVNAFGYHPIVIEVKNNTEPQVRFKSTDLTGDNWKNNYEFRHLDESKYTEEQAKAEWQKVQDFLYATDCTAATDAELPQAVTIGNWMYTKDTAEYRKAKWDAESEGIFDKRTLTFHHNITLFLLLRDNRAKNMFWSKDPKTGLWGLWFNWDNDTGLCRNNDGYVDIEPGYMDFDTLGTGDVFNGADNVVFVNLRTWDFELLKEHYLDRESAGCWDADAFYSMAMERQESICEALWIEDAAHNAIRTMQNLGTTAYLERATGRLRLHLKKALTFQKVLVDSYYCSAAATGQSSAFRGYTPANWGGVEPSGRIAVTAYTNMYINILAGSTAYRVRADEGTPVELDISASLNNTEIYFRHAPWLQDLGDLSGLYLGQFEASYLKRVRRLLIGSDNSEYYNTNFTQASFDNCTKLETLNLGGLRNAARSFDFRPNLYLKDLYTAGSAVTGVTFAKYGRLETARLNAVKSLSADTLTRLKVLSMPTYESLTTLSVEDTPALDTQGMAEGAENLERVRLIGIDWQCEDADTLLHLSTCAGRDDEGRDIPEPIVTGRAHLEKATLEELDTLAAVFPDLEISYGELVPSHSVTFCNDGGAELCTVTVRDGEYAPNPITAGLIGQPTKESDVEHHHDYAGWDKALGPITADTVITAVYAARDRYYTVRFWYDSAQTDKAQEHEVIAHGSCACTAADPDPEQEGTIWMGWDQDTSDVVSDMDVHAVYIVPKVPDSAPAEFDYLYSDDPEDVSAYSLAEFAGVLEFGLGKTYFQPGDRIKMVIPKNDTFVDRTIELMVLGFNHYRLADGSGEFAGVVFGMVGLMTARQSTNTTNTNVGGWDASYIRGYLNDTVFPVLPRQWKALIRTVQVLASEGGTSPEILTSEDDLFLLSMAEVGLRKTEVPYSNEVDPEAEEAAFGIFTDVASRVRKTYNGTGSAGQWRLRSPHAPSSEHFWMVAIGGIEGYGPAQSGIGVSFCFCAGKESV